MRHLAIEVREDAFDRMRPTGGDELGEQQAASGGPGCAWHADAARGATGRRVQRIGAGPSCRSQRWPIQAEAAR
jgi:hypothetical protein